MRHIPTILITTALCLLLSAAIPTTSPSTLTLPKIDRRPQAPNYRAFFKPLTEVPKLTGSSNAFEIDLRSRDLTSLNFSTAADALAQASFDSFTQWPAADKLPATFDPTKISDLGKDPGLGVRTLHARGITGKGVGLAIIDQQLLTTHSEYADRLRLYEEIGIKPLSDAQMHGPAVASAAVGKTCGVAPGADLYYIATRAGDFDPLTRQHTYDFSHYAKSIRRILDINRSLPPDRKIRVISLSIGWDRSQAGYDAITAAVNQAKAQNILVTSSSLEETFSFPFHGLARPAHADPNDPASYRPGSWWANQFYKNPDSPHFRNRLLIPMDHRTLAGPCSDTDYAHYATGGWSWCTPYLAGLYALACQVDPTLTPDRFRTLALQTAHTIPLQHNNHPYRLGPIINPLALIRAIESAPSK